MGKFNEWLNKKITPIPALYKNPYTGVLKDLISKQNKGETVAKKYVETQLDEDYLGRIKKDIYEYPAYAEALEVPMLQDLKNIYLKTPQTFNSFSISKYRPKNGTQTNYFNSKILDTIGAGIVVKAGDNLKNKNVVPTDKLEDMNYGEISHITPNNNAVAVLPGIGHATVGIGHDQKGEYVSYYDNWDVGNFKPNTKHLIDFFNKGVPVYGRVYLDDYYDIPEEARGNPFITPSVITAYKKGGRIHIKKKNRVNSQNIVEERLQKNVLLKGRILKIQRFVRGQHLHRTLDLSNILLEDFWQILII